MCRTTTQGGRRCPAHAPEARRAARAAKRAARDAGGGVGVGQASDGPGTPRVPTGAEVAALEALRRLVALDPSPAAVAELEAWEAAVRGEAPAPVVAPARRPRAPRTPQQQAEARLRKALLAMPDGQRIEVTASGRPLTVTYAERGTVAWYEVRDRADAIVTELEVDLDWEGDRATQVRHLLPLLTAPQDHAQAA